MSETYQIFSDGGARGNPGPSAIGVLICDSAGATVKDYGQVIGKATNNVAEYSAVICGLQMARDLKIDNIEYFVDSELVCKQINGEYRVKTPHIRDLYLKAKQLAGKFKKIQFTHVRRTHEKIQHVDALVNKALDQAEAEGLKLEGYEEYLKKDSAQNQFEF